MARPTKLTPAMIRAARAYVSEKTADRLELPTVEGLALALQIHRDSVYNWAEIPTDFYVPANITPAKLAAWEKEYKELRELHSEFFDIVSDLKNAQANKLMQNGLRGTYNATIAKLILSGKHGYVEKSEVDQNMSGNVSFVNSVPRPNRDSDGSGQST